MRRLALLSVLMVVAGVGAVACGRTAFTPASGGPPPTPTPGTLQFLSITTTDPSILPGDPAAPVLATFHNDGTIAVPLPLTALSFNDSAGNLLTAFVARQAPGISVPTSLAAGASISVPFAVEIPPSLDLTRVQAGALAGTLHPAQTFSWLVTPMIPLIVDTTGDEGTTGAPSVNGRWSLRAAILAADSSAGPVRISFDPSVFPAAGHASITMTRTLGVLPPLVASTGTSHALLIDATGRGVSLTADATLASSGLYGMTLSGHAQVEGMRFFDLGNLYPRTQVITTANNCGDGVKRNGGVILVEGTGAVISHDLFDETGTPEQNCYAREIHVAAPAGGKNHRIDDNVFLNMPGDATEVETHVMEIARNLLLPSTDDGINVEGYDGGETFIYQNVVVRMQCSGIRLVSNTTGVVHVWNNTVIGSGIGCGGAGSAPYGIVVGGPVVADLRNNALLGNNPGALTVQNGGAQVTAAFESSFGESYSQITPGNGSALAVDFASVTTSLGLMLASTSGTLLGDYSPLPGSPLIDSGTNLVDMNGGSPGTFNGARSDRGAVESP